MRDIHGVKVIESVRDFLDDRELSGRFYSLSAAKDSDFINEPERAARCYDAAGSGADGKYHWECIEDFREFGLELLSEASEAVERACEESELWDTDQTAAGDAFMDAMAEVEQCIAAFNADVDATERWHAENGTLEQQIG